MKFKNVVNKSNFNDVFECLQKNYPTVKRDDEDKIKYAYEELKTLVPQKNEEGFTIVIGVTEEDGYKNYDVSGLKKEEDALYSFVYAEREEWLDFDVDENLINTMDYSEITAHCFWEMIFYGLTQKEWNYNIEVQNQEVKINQEIERLTDELKKEKKIISDNSIDEFIDIYNNAKTTYLQTSIEVEIEELINLRLVTSLQIEKIKRCFDDEDIMKAIESMN